VVGEVHGGPASLEVDAPASGGLDEIDLLTSEQGGNLGRALVPDVDEGLVPLDHAERAVAPELIELLQGRAVGQEGELQVRHRLRVHGASARKRRCVEEV